MRSTQHVREKSGDMATLLHPLCSPSEALVGNEERCSPPANCNDALQLARVALLFLSTGALHHEGLWEAWLSAASGAIPREVSQV